MQTLPGLDIIFCTIAWRQCGWKDDLAGILVNSLSLSRLSHVCVGYKNIVIHPTLNGNRLCYRRRFLDRYHTIKYIITLPCLYPVDLFIYGDCEKKRFFPSFRRFMTRGRTGLVNDCVCLAIECIEGGTDIAVPDNVTTPRKLLKFLNTHVNK